MVVGAVAGVAGLLLLLKSGGGGGGTTAAGTSINAALGSIQEENMNLLGTTQQGFQEMGQGFGTLNTGMTTGFLNTQNSIGGLGTQMQAGFTNTNGLIGTLEQDITAQLTAFSGTTQTNFNNMNALISSGQASQAQMNASESTLLQSIQQDVTSGLVGQQQANGLLNSIIGNQNQMGNFLGWQFYQIPNRYQAMIPSNLTPPGFTPN
jgi:hypothetical protein